MRPETTQAIARCECCDLPETLCGKAAEKKAADELAAFRAQLLAQRAWIPARFPGICPCGTPFAAGTPDPPRRRLRARLVARRVLRRHPGGPAMSAAELPTRDEAVRDAGAVWAEVLETFDSLSPRQAAERAVKPGGPPVEVLEARIRELRGLAPTEGAA